MYKLAIGVGYSIFEKIIKPFSGHQDLLIKICQHSILLSDSIISYYRENIPDEYEDSLMTYLDSIMNDDSSVFFKDNTDLDAKQNLIRAVLNDPMNVLVSEKEEFNGYKISGGKLVTPECIDNRVFNNFYRFTFPISNHIANCGERCDLYATWFGHLFENEKRITFIDQYIFADNGRASFEMYYLPKISKDTIIDIYCDLKRSGFNSEEELLKYIQANYSEWKVRVHLCEHMHDRFILLSSIQISISTGVVFMDTCGWLIKPSTINISTDCSVPLPTEIKTLW